MRTFKIIGLFYVLYSLYTLFIVSVSDYKMLYATAGLMCMWMVFFSLLAGYKSIKGTEALYNKQYFDKDISFPFANMMLWEPLHYLAAMLCSWTFSILAAKFYTGRGFGAVVQGIFGGVNAYNDYQNYFNNKLSQISVIERMPYVFMFTVVTILMIWSAISILAYRNSISIGEALYLGSVIASYMYFGVARGTNFETYLVFVLIVYCLLQKFEGQINSDNLKYIGIVILGAILLVAVFRGRIADRGVVFTNNICPEIQFDSKSYIVRMFPVLSSISVSLFGYLGYGIFAIGVTISDICLSDIGAALNSLIPFGFELNRGISIGDLLRSTIDVGVKWVPDFVLALNIFGFILLILVSFAIGRLIKAIDNMRASQFLKDIIGVIVYLEMLSFPVGNFIISSTPNKLIVVFILFWVVQYKVFKVKVRI